jgi:hypothetical protein
MSDNSKPAVENPAYDNPNLLLRDERSFIGTCIRWYVGSMRDFLETESAKEKDYLLPIEHFEGRMKQIMAKLRRLQDPDEPEEEDDDDYEVQLAEIKSKINEYNNE